MLADMGGDDSGDGGVDGDRGEWCMHVYTHAGFIGMLTGLRVYCVRVLFVYAFACQGRRCIS